MKIIKVNPCDYDYKSTLSVWNAKFQSITEIWNSDYYNELRYKHLSKLRKKYRTLQKMHSDLKICLIGNGIHSKRVQKNLNEKKLKFKIYKPQSKKNFKREKLDNLKNYNAIFILSPDYTHYHYIKNLYKSSYIFCEKPPCNNKKDLKSLTKIKSKKIYYNYNFRFSEIFKLLNNRKKFNLGKLIYGNIINGKALGLKKDYSYNWRSKKTYSKKGILEVVSIHFIDLVNCLFKIKKFEIIKLLNLSKYGDSFDNSILKIITQNNSVINIYNSWTSQLINKKIFIFENGSIEEDESFITIKGPALNLDKNNFTKRPKIIKKINIDNTKDTENSLKESIDFFLDNISKGKSFNKKSISLALVSNSYIT